MQEVYDAINASTRSDTDDPAAIALILKQRTRPYDPDDDSLHVFDSEESRNDRYNLHYEQLAPTAELRLSDID